MPWKEVTAMSEKERFIGQKKQGEFKTFKELCETFGISRKTGYKWLKRAEKRGKEGLKEVSRKPTCSPKRTSEDIETLIIKTRHLHPTWGGEKLRKYLLSEGYKNLPKSEKTFDRILKRYGLITAEESEKHKAWKRFEHEHPNDLWQMDFKGYFKTLNGPCHPLTLLDDHSRYCLLIRSCGDERGETVKEALTQVFREYGLPRGMTMDNGSPWGYSGEQDHTYLTAWLIRLGIKVSHSRPNHPQTQGKLERFHRTLKEELISAYQFNDLRDAQEGFDWWRSLYNEKRPHGALSLEVPSSRYRPSERDYPLALPTIEYDEGFIIRKVQVDGTISFKGKEYRIGKAFSGQPVGLKKDEEESIYHVYFCHQKVVKIDLKYSL